MLDNSDEIYWVGVAKNLGQQFVFLAEKMEDECQIFYNLIKCIWKKTGMGKDTMADLFFRLRPHVNVNKKKGENHIYSLQPIDKY